MMNIGSIFKPDGSIDALVLKSELEGLNDTLKIVEAISNFYYFKFTIKSGMTNILQHNLNFIPKSVIILNILPGWDYIFPDYTLFTKKELALDVLIGWSAEYTIECLVGSYKEVS